MTFVIKKMSIKRNKYVEIMGIFVFTLRS